MVKKNPLFTTILGAYSGVTFSKHRGHVNLSPRVPHTVFRQPFDLKKSLRTTTPRSAISHVAAKSCGAWKLGEGKDEGRDERSWRVW